MKVGKAKWGLLSAGILLSFGVVGFLFTRPPPAEPMPNPNGYDDFVKAGQLVSEAAWRWSELSVPELRLLVETNAEALRLARAGLDKACQAPPHRWTSTTNHIEVLTRHKRVAQVFSAEIRLALLDGKTNAAANSCLDCIRFGQECCRGGVILDRLVGVAIQAIGVSPLESLLQSVDSETARRVASGLEDGLSNREPTEAVIRRDRSCLLRGQFGWTGPFYAIVHYAEMHQSENRFQQRDQQADTRLRAATLSFAVRAYELENGKRASSASELVPKYLKAVPKDPITGTGLAH